MRILYHHRTLADGAEGIHIAQMVSAFRALGHDVRVIGLAGTSTGPRPRVLGAVKNALPRAAAEIAAAAGCNAAEYVAVRWEIARYAPDLLYKRHARNDVAALAAARAEGLPSVLEVNCLYSGSDYARFEPPAFDALTRRLEERALRDATIVLAVSSPLAAQIRRKRSDGVTVLPNGADPDIFDPARWSGREVRARYKLENALILGWIGILRDWHGLDLVLFALSELPALRLLIVGDGPARPRLEARMAERGLRERVILTGRVPHDRVAEYIAAMDIAVVAEDGTRIASPMKLLEYMAMERAVVAPALDNIKDIVTHGEDGWLFEPGSGWSLAAALRRLVDAPSLRRVVGVRAREKIVRQLNWRANAAAVVQLVSELPDGLSPRAHRGG